MTIQWVTVSLEAANETFQILEHIRIIFSNLVERVRFGKCQVNPMKSTQYHFQFVFAADSGGRFLLSCARVGFFAVSTGEIHFDET